ncbi:SAGA-associated factor 29 isoform X4 [Erinaceus europaeus]|uniref:SAGA-associated factor 29 isoform X4 n=1 Tax=Erinaceus europaeus TaxID=9365 RepID=A0ABM3VXN5_ERIEU|nr:SAGA-associated factor 29 isoform X4 [Erinaceus europaeus]
MSGCRRRTRFLKEGETPERRSPIHGVPWCCPRCCHVVPGTSCMSLPTTGQSCGASTPPPRLMQRPSAKLCPLRPLLGHCPAVFLHHIQNIILRKALDKIAEIKSLLEERRIAAKIAGLYNDSEPPRKTMRRGVLMTLLQQSAMTLPLWIGKPGDKPPPLCGAIPASGDYVAKPGDKVAARVKAVDGDEQWILAEVVSYSHATNKYEVDDIDEEGKERHTLSRRRIIPLPQWKANPETDPEALFQKEQLVLALYPQTTCFYRALIHTPPQRPQDDYSVLFEDTSYADGYSPPLNVAQRYVVACKEPKKK